MALAISPEMPLARPHFWPNRANSCSPPSSSRRSVTPSVTVVDSDAGLTVCHCIAPHVGAKLGLIQQRIAKRSYLRAQFNRLAQRRGVKKAVVAVAASILTSAYFILRDGVAYRDLGPDYLDRRDPGKVAQRLAKRIEALGFSVELRPAA